MKLAYGFRGYLSHFHQNAQLVEQFFKILLVLLCDFGVF
jgi:hypothetical protein